MKRYKYIALIVIIALFFTGCSSFQGNKKESPAITMTPSALDLGRGRLATLPPYDKYQPAPLQVDLRQYDLTSLNLREKYDDLIHADFDTGTRWPYGLPGGFNPKEIIKYGKNPGLNIRKLHKAGITGKGVRIAIIDGALLTNHEEYKDRLRLYEEIHCLDKTATVSGCASASAAVGKDTGVAPGAELYYIADTPRTYNGYEFETNNTWLASTIKRVIEINAKMPPGNRIRVLAIGYSCSSGEAGYSDVSKAVKEAAEQGIFVVSNTIYDTYGHEMDFNGLGRDPLSDPEDASSYLPGQSWASRFFMFERISNAKETLLVPMDSRCTASPTGEKDYAFYNCGGLNVSAAYIAGLYALACQVKPGITPEVFWDKALETGDTVKVKNSNFKHVYRLKRVVNPVKLMDAVKKVK